MNNGNGGGNNSAEVLLGVLISFMIFILMHGYLTGG